MCVVEEIGKERRTVRSHKKMRLDVITCSALKCRMLMFVKSLLLFSENVWNKQFLIKSAIFHVITICILIILIDAFICDHIQCIMLSFRTSLNEPYLR